MRFICQTCQSPIAIPAKTYEDASRLSWLEPPACPGCGGSTMADGLDPLAVMADDDRERGLAVIRAHLTPDIEAAIRAAHAADPAEWSLMEHFGIGMWFRSLPREARIRPGPMSHEDSIWAPLVELALGLRDLDTPRRSFLFTEA